MAGSERLHACGDGSDREANIKLETVLSDVMGRSGRAMIQALIDGETDPAKLAALAHWKVRASAATLREALHGRIKRHHRFLLRLHLQQIDALDAAIAEVDREADTGYAPRVCWQTANCRARKSDLMSVSAKQAHSRPPSAAHRPQPFGTQQDRCHRLSGRRWLRGCRPSLSQVTIAGTRSVVSRL